jgi:hypothetical protein
MVGTHNWKTFSEGAKSGPATYEFRQHLSFPMRLTPAYVNEDTFRRIVSMSATDEDRQRDVWSAAEIYYDALVRFRRGDKEDPYIVLGRDDPCIDEWTSAEGRQIPVPDLMRHVNSSECQLGSPLRLKIRESLRGADTIFGVEAAYKALHDIRAFSTGLFMLGKHFQPSRRGGDMNLVENASFMIGELKSMLASAHLDPDDIDALRRQLAESFEIDAAIGHEVR